MQTFITFCNALNASIVQYIVDIQGCTLQVSKDIDYVSQDVCSGYPRIIDCSYPTMYCVGVAGYAVYFIQGYTVVILEYTL